MQKDLLHEFACENIGSLIKASDAKKGGIYYCPSCKDKFILRKSGNTVKGSRRPHFAHNALEGNCSYESYLHNTFKIKVLELINQNIKNNLPLNINWKCNICNQDHHVNFTDISKVFSEYNLKERVPDIAILNGNGTVFMVIEIVYKHPPENEAISYYEQNKIILIQITISTEDDLNNVEYKLNNPTKVFICVVPTQHIYVPPKPIIRNRNNGIYHVMENPNNYYKKGKTWYPKKYKGR